MSLYVSCTILILINGPSLINYPFDFSRKKALLDTCKIEFPPSKCLIFGSNLDSTLILAAMNCIAPGPYVRINMVYDDKHSSGQTRSYTKHKLGLKRNTVHVFFNVVMTCLLTT